MRAATRGFGFAGVVAVLLALFSAPAVAAPDASADPEQVFCGFHQPGDVSDVATWAPTYDPDTGDLVGLGVSWMQHFDCSAPVETPYSVMEGEFNGALWYADTVPVSIGDDDCSIVDGEPSCDLITTSGFYVCDQGVECAGYYHFEFTVHVVMAPAISMYEIPEYCEELRPAPAQVVDCFYETSTLHVTPSIGT